MGNDERTAGSGIESAVSVCNRKFSSLNSFILLLYSVDIPCVEGGSAHGKASFSACKISNFPRYTLRKITKLNRIFTVLVDQCTEKS